MDCKSASKVDGRWPVYIYILQSSHLPVSRFQYPLYPGVPLIVTHPRDRWDRELTGLGGHREAVALVMAQNAVNVTWDTAKGAGGAVRASERDVE